jgi:hypothetical protein
MHVESHAGVQANRFCNATLAMHGAVEGSLTTQFMHVASAAHALNSAQQLSPRQVAQAALKKEENPESQTG